MKQIILYYIQVHNRHTCFITKFITSEQLSRMKNIIERIQRLALNSINQANNINVASGGGDRRGCWLCTYQRGDLSDNSDHDTNEE